MATYDVNKDLMRGDDIFLYLTSGNSVLAFATSCSLQIDGATIDTANKMSCRWTSNLAGKNSYSVSADALYVDKRENSAAYSFDDLLAAMVAGDAINWAMAPCATWTGSCETNTFAIDSANIIAKGKGMITSLSLNAGSNEVASCSISITGSGEVLQS